MGDYFNIIINNKDHTFYIEDSKKAQKHGSALETLKKMEIVLKDGGYKYKPGHEDNYSTKTRNELYQIFKQKSLEIHEGYTAKLSKLYRLDPRKLFSKEKKISKIHRNIDSYIKPPPALHSVINKNVFAIMAGHMNDSDVGNLAKVNRQARVLAENLMLQQAKRHGFSGVNEADAKKYMEVLFKDIKILVNNKTLPEKCLCHDKDGKLDKEKSLANLVGLSPAEVRKIFEGKKDIYKKEFGGVCKLLLPSLKKALKEYPPVPFALVTASSFDNIELAKLLLKYEPNPNFQHFGKSAIAHANKNKNAEMIKLLKDHGAKDSKT